MSDGTGTVGDGVYTIARTNVVHLLESHGNDNKRQQSESTQQPSNPMEVASVEVRFDRSEHACIGLDTVGHVPIIVPTLELNIT